MSNFSSPSAMFPEWMTRKLPDLLMQEFPSLRNPDDASLPPMPPAPELASVAGPPTDPAPPTGLPSLGAGAPTPPALPPLLERTDTPDLQAFGGDIHKNYQPLIDMALQTMMQRDGIGGGGFHMNPLGALGMGLAAGTGHGNQLAPMLDVASQMDEERSKRALAAGHLLGELAGAEASNQEGLERNVDAWRTYRLGQMDPTSEGFKNLKDFEQGLNPAAKADATIQRLPDIKKLDASKVKTEEGRLGKITQQTQGMKDVEPFKVDAAISNATTAANRADTTGAQAVYADATYKAKLDHEIAATDAIKNRIAQQNGNIARGPHSKQWKVIEAADKDLTQLSVDQRQFEKMLRDEQKMGTPNEELIGVYANKISNIVRAKREAQDARKQAIDSIPVDGSQMMPGKAKAGLPEVKTEASPTPLPDGAQISQTPGLDATPKGSLIAAGPPKNPVVGKVYQSPNGPMKFLGGDQWQRQAP